MLSSPMSLHLYRRHQIKCEAARPEHSRTGEFEELKEGWKRCACVIFVDPSLPRDPTAEEQPREPPIV